MGGMMNEYSTKEFSKSKSRKGDGPVIDSGCISAANFLWHHKHEMKLYPNDPINGKTPLSYPLLHERKGSALYLLSPNIRCYIIRCLN